MSSVTNLQLESASNPETERNKAISPTKDDKSSGPASKSEFTMPDRPDYYKSVSKSVDVRQLMMKYGLDAGFHLPFATAENKALMEELEACQIKLLKLRGDIAESQDAINDLKGHATQSAINIRFTQNLVDSKSLQKDREGHNDAIEVQSQAKRIRQLQRLKNDQAEYTERNRVRLLDLEARKDRVKSLQEKVLLGQKRLAEWKATSGKTESFLQLIIGHKAHDDRHAWELENKQTDLGAMNKEFKMELDAAAMNTTKLSEQYARLSIEYRKEHKERKEMVSMWSATLETMKRKDQDVKDISKEFCAVRKKLRDTLASIQQQEKVVLEQEWNCRQIELDQNILDRSVSEMRQAIREDTASVNILRNEVTMNKLVISQTSAAARGMETGFRQAEARVRYFKKKATILDGILEDLRKQLDRVKEGKASVDEYLGKMEEELRQEDKRFHKTNREVEKMRKFSWERNNDKTGIEEQIVRAETRQSRLKSNINVLQLKEYDSMEALAKKQSQLYRLDLDISSLETRMNRIVDDSVNPEYFKLQTALVNMRNADMEILEEKEFIQKEVHVMKEFAYRYKKEIEVYSKKQENLRAMVDNINLEAKRMQGVLNSTQNEKKFLTIQFSLDKITLRTLHNTYKANRGRVLSLAQRRAAMQWAVLERKSEIKFAMQLLSKQRKELRGHTSKRKLAISNMNNFTEKLKGRFELTTRLMAPEEGMEGEDAMTFQIHKIARERETLAAEQMKWETRVMEARDETEGLTNTLLLMKSSNAAFKKNLAIAAMDSTEAKEVDKAMKNQKKSIVIRNRCNKAGAKLRISMDALQKQIDVTIQESEELLHILENKERDASSKYIEHNRLRDRIHRWNNLLAKKTKQLKGKADEVLNSAAHYLKYQLITLKFTKGVEQLELTISDHPRIKEMALSYLETHNLMRDFEKAKRSRLASTTTGRSVSSFHSRSSGFPGVRRLQPNSGRSRQSTAQSQPTHSSHPSASLQSLSNSSSSRKSVSHMHSHLRSPHPQPYHPTGPDAPSETLIDLSLTRVLHSDHQQGASSRNKVHDHRQSGH